MQSAFDGVLGSALSQGGSSFTTSIYPLLDRFDAEIEGWRSASPVTPLAKQAARPADFTHLDKVQFYG